MLAGVDELLAVVKAIYGPAGPPTRLRKFWIIRGVREVQQGGDPMQVARTIRASGRSLRELAAQPDPIKAVFKKTLAEAAEPRAMELARRNLGQMLPAVLAERVFSGVFARTLGTSGIKLTDERHAYTETDFLI